MFEASGRVRLVGWVETLQELVGLAPTEDGAVLLIDIDKSVDLGLLRELCRRPTRHVCLFPRGISPELFFQTREAGVSGIIGTSRPANEIVAAICDISEGQLFFDPHLTEGNTLARTIHLTPREGHLIELLTQGLKNKEIAFQLGITEGTVKVYLSKLFQKVGAKDRFDLALSGLKNLGLVPAGAGSDQADASTNNSQALRTLVTRLAPVRERRSDTRALAG